MKTVSSTIQKILDDRAGKCACSLGMANTCNSIFFGIELHLVHQPRPVVDGGDEHFQIRHKLGHEESVRRGLFNEGYLCNNTGFQP